MLTVSEQIKSLMLRAIKEKRPDAIDRVCRPVWNQPFFFMLDKAQALTISYAPTDKGAAINYRAIYDAYKTDRSSLSPEQIYDILYTFKKEPYWRNRFDTIFSALGVPPDRIAHMDMSPFPYDKDVYRKYYTENGTDTTYKYVLKAIDILSDQLKYIFIDGKDNFDIIEKYLIQDYCLRHSTAVTVNSGGHKTPLLIYKHRSKDITLIYFGTFLYGMTCVSAQCLSDIANYIKAPDVFSPVRDAVPPGRQPPGRQPPARRADTGANAPIGTSADKKLSLKIRPGQSPEHIGPPVSVRAGQPCLLVYDGDECVGLVWEHSENRPSPANGQAEIRFFDSVTDRYRKWHRMFDDGGRIMYFDLKADVTANGVYYYRYALKKKN